MLLKAIHLPNRDGTWDVSIEDGKIASIEPSSPISSSPSTTHLLAPALTHPHIHLDKPHLLCSAQYPNYAPLAPTSGTFAEALSNTSRAKQRYTRDDLLQRGSQLIAESVQFGVSSMRAFVEVDSVTRFLCLDVGLELKQRFEATGLMKVQLCVFAQDPVFSGAHGDTNRRLLEEALTSRPLGRQGIEVLGSTPYVESSEAASLQNIEWAVRMALQHDVHLDFHLDYNLDAAKQPMAWDVIRMLGEQDWIGRAKKDKTICLGHCTRLSLFSEAEWKDLAAKIRESRLPISFVGLPTSDLYMMGREDGKSPRRGTLPVPKMIREYGLDACVGVNNVANAFTPWGSADPLGLACLGVGVYHAGSKSDAQLLYEAVSTRAYRAIGIGTERGPEVREGQVVDHILFETGGDMEITKGLSVPARTKTTSQEVVWEPPPASARKLLTKESTKEEG